MSDETTLYFNLDDEDNEKRVVVRVSELVRCLKHFRESLLCNGGDYEHDMRETGGHLKAATLGSGKLTAEQVRKAIFAGSVYASYDGAQYYASGINMQAIADELNATLGSVTCKFEPKADEPPKCDHCGWQASIYDCEWVCENGYAAYEYDGRYCKECGAKVVEP